jgi:formyltetrahydrofolate hydrolase
MSDANAILFLSCPDQKGLVATISKFIFQFHTESRILVHGVKTVIFE